MLSEEFSFRVYISYGIQLNYRKKLEFDTATTTNKDDIGIGIVHENVKPIGLYWFVYTYYTT